MKYFSVPSDFKFETLDKLYELNSKYQDSKVIETFGQITEGKLINSGRVVESLPKMDIDSLKRYVKYSSERDIAFNYTLNPACLGNYEFSVKGVRELKDFLSRLVEIGVTNMTVSSPSIMELIRETKLDIKIKASAICEINSPSKALFYKNLGCKRVVTEADITRDFTNLKNIAKVFGPGTEVIVNNVCYKNCAYKMFHYNHEAHCTPGSTQQDIKEYYFNRCFIQKAGGLISFMRLNWVRPEDMKFYLDSGISHFKIQGRHNVSRGDLIKTLVHYFEEDYDGNLYDLITLFAPYNSFQSYVDNKKLDGYVQKFYDHPTFCKDICSECHYCELYAKKSMDEDKTNEINRQAVEFFSEYDVYSKEIKAEAIVSTPEEGVLSGVSLDSKFSFED